MKVFKVKILFKFTRNLQKLNDSTEYLLNYVVINTTPTKDLVVPAEREDQSVCLNLLTKKKSDNGFYHQSLDINVYDLFMIPSHTILSILSMRHASYLANIGLR